MKQDIPITNLLYAIRTSGIGIAKVVYFIYQLHQSIPIAKRNYIFNINLFTGEQQSSFEHL